MLQVFSLLFLQLYIISLAYNDKNEISSKRQSMTSSTTCHLLSKHMFILTSWWKVVWFAWAFYGLNIDYKDQNKIGIDISYLMSPKFYITQLDNP